MRVLTESVNESNIKVEQVKSENIKLFEKMRFMQSYQSPSRNTEEVPFKRDDLTFKYSSIYEDHLDPFSRFHKSEEKRRIEVMNPAERVTLSITKMILTNRYGRWIFVGYSGLLHLLVLVTVYQLSSNSICLKEVHVKPGVTI